jgi:RNA polymerase sigma-70 factor (ECF subfamily)
VSADIAVEADFVRLTDPYRRELLAHCYRMLGSLHDAEDLVQETYLRAWRGYPAFEARSSLRTWLHRIATRACLSALAHRERRVLPSGLGPPDLEAVPPAARLDTVAWLQPIPDALLPGNATDPATIVEHRESTRLAFVAALQHLLPRQRAALLLCDVLGHPAADAAAMLGTSIAATNSALQRARAQVARTAPREEDVDPAAEAGAVQRYLTAFARADVGALAQLLRDDVELEMPPHPTWYAGRAAVTGFLAQRALGAQVRLTPAQTANGGHHAAATYHRGPDRVWRPHGLHVLEVSGGLISRMTIFLDVGLFPPFGLPPVLPG